MGTTMIVMGALLGLGMLAVIAAAPSERAVRGNYAAVRGSGRLQVARHEGGHYAARGPGRVKRVVVRSGSGEVVLTHGSVARMSSRQYIAFMLAGCAAEGSAAGGDDDRANVAAEVDRMRRAGVPAGVIRATVRAAEADAERYGHSAEVERFVKRWSR